MSYAKLAAVHQQLDDKVKALDYLQQGQTIMAQLTKLSPENAIWARDLDWFNTQLAELASKEAG